MGASDWYFSPSIKFNGSTQHFCDTAERAIAWWKSLVPSTAQPMDANGNVLP